MVNLFPGVPPQCLCDKHLNTVLAEYNNLLMPSMRKGKSISGYIRHGCVDLPNTYSRILECLAEVKTRGKEWKYQVPDIGDAKLHMELMEKYRNEFSDIDDSERRREMAEMNMRVLAFRCQECRARIVEGMVKNE
jgi:hypothetical protein